MKTQFSAVRKTLRAIPAAKRGAHHQIASRRLRDAVMFETRNPQHAQKLLAEAQFHATFAAAVL